MFKFLCIEIKIFMIKFFNNLSPDHFRQEFKVYYIACFLVGFAGYLYLHFIIMPMIIRQGAFAKNFLIPGIIPGRIIQAMGGIKMFFSENRYFFTHIFKLQN